MNPEYLRDVQARSGEVDLRNRSLELSRRSRALKIWLTLRTYGADRLGLAVERGIALAERAEQLLRHGPALGRRHARTARRGDLGAARSDRHAAGGRGSGAVRGRLRVGHHHDAARPLGTATVHAEPTDHRGGPARHDRAAGPATSTTPMTRRHRRRSEGRS